MTEPFPLILISSPEDFADEHILIESMFKRGLQTFHLRKPRKDTRGMERWLFELDPELRSHVVVHGFPELVEAFGLAGFHGRDSEHSFSAHSFVELVLAHKCQYAFLSPIFDSFSKIGHTSQFSELELRRELAKLALLAPKSIAVFALGGVYEGNLATIVSMGFSGAAVLGSIWNTADPLGSWNSLRDQSYWVRELEPVQYPEVESWRTILQERREGHL
jgi:thiamine-phosphate pyrophosphorylase